MHPSYPKLFTPIRLGPVEVRNRFYSSPHAMPMGTGAKPSHDYVAYNVARARGGVGLIMLSRTIPERSAGVQPKPNPPETVAAFRTLVDAVHAEDTRIFAEPFYHWCGSGSWMPFGPPAPILGPSVAQLGFMERRATTRAMSRHEIAAMLAAWREAATNLRTAGFDGIMLHASHGALQEQFLSPYYNRRTDEYGGSLENRARLLVESLEVVREAAGPGMAVGMRLNCDELFAAGYHTADASEVLRRIAAGGLIDFVDLDIAVEPNQFHLGMPPVFIAPHVYKPYVAVVRGAAGDIPVLSVLGRLTSVADAESILASGLTDMVGAARALIAEPELIRNAQEGREERSRTCIACNACMAGFMEGMQTCAINPGSYRERFWGPDSFAPAPKRGRLVVVGAGPAGLEAARVGALRGHEVVLIEARDSVGGALARWSRLPGRDFYFRAVEWWERELRRLGVEICLGAAADGAAILAERPDAVILAMGALYSREGRSSHLDQPIPGHDRAIVHLPEDVLLGTVRPRGRVVLLDAEGLHTGAGLAEQLAAGGCEVELLTPGWSPLSARLADTQDAPFIAKRLIATGVKHTPLTYLRRIGEQSVVAYNVHSEAEHVIADVDAVILATGREPCDGLEAELDGRVAQLFTVGDAAGARAWQTAAFEGHKFARLVGEPDAPASLADAYFRRDDPMLFPVSADVAA